MRTIRKGDAGHPWREDLYGIPGCFKFLKPGIYCRKSDHGIFNDSPEDLQAGGEKPGH